MDKLSISADPLPNLRHVSMRSTSTRSVIAAALAASTALLGEFALAAEVVPAVSARLTYDLSNMRITNADGTLAQVNMAFLPNAGMQVKLDEDLDENWYSNDILGSEPSVLEREAEGAIYVQAGQQFVGGANGQARFSVGAYASEPDVTELFATVISDYNGETDFSGTYVAYIDLLKGQTLSFSVDIEYLCSENLTPDSQIGAECYFNTYSYFSSDGGVDIFNRANVSLYNEGLYSSEYHNDLRARANADGRVLLWLNLSAGVSSGSSMRSDGTAIDIPSFVPLSPVPEPSSYHQIALGLGILGAAGAVRRRRHRPETGH